jgi:hypothetical protein
MADMPCSSDFPVITTTAVHQMANGDAFSIVVWQSSGGSLSYGGAFAGQSSNSSSRVSIVVL